MSCEKTVEKEIDEAFFPRIDIQGTLFAAKIAMQCDAGSKGERFAAERVVDRSKMAHAVAGEVV